MKLISAYQFLNKRLQPEYLEPAWGWGFRVAFSVTLPLLWGVLTGEGDEALWMAIAAECVSFIELKGNIGQRIRLLLSASVLSVLFCIAGSLAGNYVWISIPGMLVVGFLSGLFKNLGDRGTGLALSVYIFYIITSSYPVQDADALWMRCGSVAIGALWTVIVGMLSFLFIRVGTPYRRTIAAIWKSVAALAKASGKGWDGRSPRSSVREIYLKEKDVRTAIDNSLALFEETLDQVNKNHKAQYALAQSRRCASLISLHIIHITETAGQLSKLSPGRQLMLRLHSLFRVMEQLGERMEIYLLSLKEEERLLVFSRIERLRKIITFLREPDENASVDMGQLLTKIQVLSERVAKLIEKTLDVLKQPGEKRVYRAYSFAQTLSILHPRYIRNNFSQLFHFNSLTTRYALRIGIATMLGAVFSHLFFPDHGYWIPFTAIIVSQPYFGATLKKGIERSAGTIAGILVGTGFLLLPFPDPLMARLILVFISSVLLIYFLKTQYSVATFFITLMLIGLLAIEPHFDAHLLMVRIVSTLIGSALAITAGFLLLPAWDKDHLPKYLADALNANFIYFQNTFYQGAEEGPWTKVKRIAESKNSNAFDSFTRYMQEPGIRRKRGYASFYSLLTHNVRVTRELNNYHSESELAEDKVPIREKEKFFQLLYECDDLFRENAKLLRKSGNAFVEDKFLKTFPESGFYSDTPTEAQVVYAEKMLFELKSIHASLSVSPLAQYDL